MKNAILLVGMRGSGKTTYGQLVKARHPEVHLISRDQFYEANFSKCMFDPYTGEGAWAADCFWRHIQDMMKTYRGTFLLDSWTGYVSERRAIIKRLREYGADSVVCWYINVEKKTCALRFAERELPKKSYGNRDSTIQASYHDWAIFHKNLQDIFPTEEDRMRFLVENEYNDVPVFDQIRVIQSDQGILPGMPLI